MQAEEYPRSGQEFFCDIIWRHHDYPFGHQVFALVNIQILKSYGKRAKCKIKKNKKQINLIRNSADTNN